jgi:hypothetical protein
VSTIGELLQRFDSAHGVYRATGDAETAGDAAEKAITAAAELIDTVGLRADAGPPPAHPLAHQLARWGAVDLVATACLSNGGRLTGVWGIAPDGLLHIEGQVPNAVDPAAVVAAYVGVPDVAPWDRIGRDG